MEHINTAGRCTHQEVEEIANDFKIDATLIKSIIAVESGNDHFAIRAEPKYRYVWDCRDNQPFRRLSSEEVESSEAPDYFTAEVGSINTEWWGQKTSWGAMQVMGAVARELGYKGYFTCLCSNLGIYYGTMHLANLKRRFESKYGTHGVIAAYNYGHPRVIGGRFANQSYVDKVLSFMEEG